MFVMSYKWQMWHNMMLDSRWLIGFVNHHMIDEQLHKLHKLTSFQGFSFLCFREIFLSTKSCGYKISCMQNFLIHRRCDAT